MSIEAQTAQDAHQLSSRKSLAEYCLTSLQMELYCSTSSARFLSLRSLAAIRSHGFRITCIFCTIIFCAIIFRTDLNHRHYLSIPAPLSSCAAVFSIPSWSCDNLSSTLPGHCFACTADDFQRAFPKTHILLVFSSYLCLHIIIIYTITVIPISILYLHAHSAKVYILHLL